MRIKTKNKTNRLIMLFATKLLIVISLAFVVGLYYVPKAHAATAPDVPTSLLATATSTTQINLSWSAPSDDGGSVITNYQIQYKLASDSTYTDWVHSPSNSTSVSITDLAAGQTYDFEVAAINDEGTSPFSATSTTGTTAYAITSCGQLQGMNGDLAGTYQLTSDVDCSDSASWNDGHGFVPVGSVANNNFTGSLDGQGYNVNSLTIGDGSSGLAGLCWIISNGATIQNITFNNLTVSGSNIVGSLAGELFHSTVENVAIVNGSITSANLAGGLAGVSIGGEFNNSSYTGSVAAVQATGGVTAEAAVQTHISGVITNVVILSTNQAGGIAGVMDGESTIEFSSSTGTITVTDYTVGGLVGHITGDNNTVSSSNSSATINGPNAYVGGLVGLIDGASTINNSYATGTVNGANFTGGLVGTVNGGTVANSYSTGIVHGYHYVGGLAGEINTAGGITNSYATGSVTGDYFLGGLIGIRNGGSVANSFSSGYVDRPYLDYDKAFIGYDTLDGASLTNNWFNSYGQDICAFGNTIPVVSSDCTGVDLNAQPNYWINNNDVSPLTSWDFDDIWYTSNGLLPQLQDRPTANSVTTIAHTATTLTISWVFDAQGSSITSYSVRYRTRGSGDAWQYVVLSPTTATSVTIDGLIPGTWYEVEVAATNAVGTSQWSAIDTQTAAASPTPAATSTTNPLTNNLQSSGNDDPSSSTVVTPPLAAGHNFETSALPDNNSNTTLLRLLLLLLVIFGSFGLLYVTQQE